MRLFTVAILAAFSLPVAAQAHVGPCGLRSQLLKFLAEEYGETPVAYGIAGDGAVVIEQTLSGDGSWTVFVTYANGQSCGLASGEAWQALGAPRQRPLPTAKVDP